MNYIHYKNYKPVNLDKIVHLIKGDNEPYITFVSENREVTWNFKYQAERDLVFDEIHQISREIKVFFVPEEEWKKEIRLMSERVRNINMGKPLKEQEGLTTYIFRLGDRWKDGDRSEELYNEIINL